jgi:hypothetical protein
MWVKISLTSAGLGALGVFCKTTWSLSHRKINEQKHKMKLLLEPNVQICKK